MSDAATANVSAPAAPANAGPAAPDAGGNPVSAPETKAAAEVAAERRRLTAADLDAYDVEIKVDGQGGEKSLRDIVAEYQRRDSATRRYQAATAERQALQAERAALTQALTDPSRFRAELAAMGMSPRELAEKVLQQELEEQSLSPEERRHRQLTSEIRQMEAMREQQAQQRIQAEATQLRGRYETFFAQQMDAAGVPAAAAPIRQAVMNSIVDHFTAKVGAGGQVTPSELQHIARTVYGEIVNSWRSSMSEQERRAMIQDADVQWYQQQRAGSKPQAMPSPPQQQGNPNHHANAQPRGADGKFIDPVAARNEARKSFGSEKEFMALLSGRR